MKKNKKQQSPKPLKKSKKKKTAVKKTVKKKTTSLKSLPTFRSVSGHLTFKLSNGQEITSVVELACVLDQMDDQVYRTHVSETYNHFSNWISDVFRLKNLAKQISGCTKEQAQIIILKHVVHEVLKRQ